MNIALPTIIQGPAYILHGGVVIYVESDVTVEESVETWNPKSTFGDLGERLKSRSFKISATPVGMVTAGLLNYFFGAHLAPQTYVGASVIPAANYALTICSLSENKTYGYVRAGLTQPPDLQFGPGKTLFGKATWTAIGAAAVQPTTNNALKAAVGTITPDTTFSAAHIESDIYVGALGGLGSPLNSLGSMDGFMFKFGYKTKPIMASDIGIADIILDSDGFNLGVTFAPSNLTEAQMDTWMNYQGATAILPGQALGGSASGAGNLVLTGVTYGWVFSANQVGPKSVKRAYQIGTHRFPNGALEMVNALGVTTGVPNPLFTFTAGT